MLSGGLFKLYRYGPILYDNLKLLITYDNIYCIIVTYTIGAQRGEDMSRRLARELSMKILFEMHINNDFNLDKIKYHLQEKEINQNQNDYIYRVLTEVTENLTKLDKIIENYSKGWKLNRIANVDLAILRLALSEMLYMEDIPYKVSIDEAIELSKIYSSGDAPAFINGILDSYVKNEYLK